MPTSSGTEFESVFDTMNDQMDRPWLAEYGDVIPAAVDVDRYPNVVGLIAEACTRFADKQAYSSFGGGLSYREVDARSRDFAGWLQQVAGVKKGDRIALMAPNMLAFPVAMFAILRTGAVQVNVNPQYTTRELEHQLNDAEVETIVIFAGATATLAEVIDQTPVKRVIVLQLDDLVDKGVAAQPIDERLSGVVMFVDALAQGRGQSFDPVEIKGDDLIFLQYTGGTTGLSKGAMLTHRNLVANILQYEAFAGSQIDWGNEVVMTAIPMYHIFALMVNTLSHFRFGATNVLITNPRDMAGFVAEWANWQVTVFTGVNTLYNGLLLTPGFAELDFSRLKICVGGGAAVQAAVSEKWRAVTGRYIQEGYGLSETSPVLTLNPLDRDEFKGSIGIPLPSTDLSLRDDDGKSVGAGESGELCAKGPQVMKGYWRREEATAEAMTADGYFRTGDIATVDVDGYFRIVDRKKDMTIVSGFNVFPNEIEAVVAQMPEVEECACIGVADDKTGEAVKLFVVKLEQNLDQAAVREFCRKELVAYKVPKHIVFIDELPKSAVGKILRRELRNM